jgi:hypothetical protein
MSIRSQAVRIGGEKPANAPAPDSVAETEAPMKQYLISVYQPEGGTIDPDALAKVRRDLDAVNEELKAAGAWVFAGGLNYQSTATVVRLRDGEVVMTDGPFAEAKEYVAGISIIAAADLDAALEWTGKLARAITLPLEVRPFADESER